MKGFDPQFSDFVDYIIKITHEIWEERGIGRLYEYYSTAMKIHTSSGQIYGRVEARSDLHITGVDRALIDPARHVRSVPVLHNVEFQGDVDLREPTGLGTFDAVTSQYGIEYLGLAEAPGAVDRHLGEGGRVALLVHDRDSILLAQSRENLAEMDDLCSAGPVGGLASWCRAGLDNAGLESVTRRFIAGPQRRTRQLTGQIIQAVDQCLSQDEAGNGSAARAVAENVLERFDGERARLRQLDAAALDAVQIRQFVAALGDCGIECAAPRSLSVRVSGSERASIGWCISGHRAR